MEKRMHLLVLGLALALGCVAQSSAGAAVEQSHATVQATSPSPSASPAAPAAAQTPSAIAPESPDSSSPGTANATQEEAALESRIQSALGKDPTLSHVNVHVAVSAEAVELTGSVASSRERLTATRIAQSFAGSKRVVTRITVVQGPQELGAPEKKNVSGSQRPFRR